MSTRPTTLDEWLDYQLGVHALGVDLGLARIATVWQRLGATRPAPIVITVGGTNGKGSTVAFLEAMLRAAGHRVGCYTSPHLLRYNERVRVDGRDAGDAELIAAFERIDDARLAGDAVPLTYFEFGTLAAFCVFAAHGVDVAILEVGLGGRLDAVNLIDADVAIVTTIDIDHQDWLGDTREAIAREKAGIFRTGRPAVIGDAQAPVALLEAALAVGAMPLVAGRDFAIDAAAGDWSLAIGARRLRLPQPTLAAPVQRANAAAAIVALDALRPRLDLPDTAFASGVRDAQVGARLQRITLDSGATLVIDVAHNAQAAQVLADWLAAQPAARTHFVFGALGDKDIGAISQALAGIDATWHIAALDPQTPRGLGADALAARLARGITPRALHDAVSTALDAASADLGAGDRLIAFGSFFVAADALRWAALHGDAGAEVKGRS